MIAQSPRVAVLVACHNDGITVRGTIDSLRVEPDIELVVVDDGSTDPRTRKALAALERDGIRVLYQENKGPSTAWLNGLSESTAHYVLPLSTVVVLYPGQHT